MAVERRDPLRRSDEARARVRTLEEADAAASLRCDGGLATCSVANGDPAQQVSSSSDIWHGADDLS
jgi:hypothetical protein